MSRIPTWKNISINNGAAERVAFTRSLADAVNSFGPILTNEGNRQMDRNTGIFNNQVNMLSDPNTFGADYAALALQNEGRNLDWNGVADNRRAAETSLLSVDEDRYNLSRRGFNEDLDNANLRDKRLSNTVSQFEADNLQHNQNMSDLDTYANVSYKEGLTAKDALKTQYDSTLNDLLGKYYVPNEQGQFTLNDDKFVSSASKLGVPMSAIGSFLEATKKGSSIKSRRSLQDSIAQAKAKADNKGGYEYPEGTSLFNMYLETGANDEMQRLTRKAYSHFGSKKKVQELIDQSVSMFNQNDPTTFAKTLKKAGVPGL